MATDAVIFVDGEDPGKRTPRIKVSAPGYTLALDVSLSGSEAKRVADFLKDVLATFPLNAVIKDA